MTGAADIKVTEDYSTSSFILAFIRFSCKVGYPGYPNCNSMKFTFLDVRSKLNVLGVDVDICPVGAPCGGSRLGIWGFIPSQ